MLKVFNYLIVLLSILSASSICLAEEKSNFNSDISLNYLHSFLEGTSEYRSSDNSQIELGETGGMSLYGVKAEIGYGIFHIGAGLYNGMLATHAGNYNGLVHSLFVSINPIENLFIEGASYLSSMRSDRKGMEMSLEDFNSVGLIWKTDRRFEFGLLWINKLEGESTVGNTGVASDVSKNYILFNFGYRIM